MKTITPAEIAEILNEEFHCMILFYDNRQEGTPKYDQAMKIKGFLQAIKAMSQLDKSLESLYEKLCKEF